MPKEIATRVLLKRMKERGWEKLRPGKGSHTIYGCPCGKHQVPVPDGHREISPGVHDKVLTAMRECEEGK